MSGELDRLTEENNPKGGESRSGASSASYSGGLDYDTALEKTIFLEKYRARYPRDDRWYKRMCGGCVFQLLFIISFIIIDNEIDPLIYGLGFLEIEPKHF